MEGQLAEATSNSAILYEQDVVAKDGIEFLLHVDHLQQQQR